jgi:hypothetical protein
MDQATYIALVKVDFEAFAIWNIEGYKEGFHLNLAKSAKKKDRAEARRMIKFNEGMGVITPEILNSLFVEAV